MISQHELLNLIAKTAYQECGVTATAPHIVKTVVSDSTQNLSQHRRAPHALTTHLAQQSVPAASTTVHHVLLVGSVRMGSVRLDTQQKAAAPAVFLVNIMETTASNVLLLLLHFFSTERF